MTADQRIAKRNTGRDTGHLRSLASCGRAILQTPSWLLIGLVRVYQWTLSPLIGPTCRFEPSCSEYFIRAVRKYGVLRGSVRGLLRICRCHPFHPGGYDPP